MTNKIKVGIIGGGQLGMMLAKASSKINIIPLVYSNTKDAPAAKFAKVYYGNFDDLKKIKDFINSKKYKVKIIISDEKNMLLDTGGGILHATRSFKKPFIAINPDTLWSDIYCNELNDLEDLYFRKKKPCLLLVNKNLSFDNSFKGDFNLKDGVISRDNSNEFIFTGLQILDQSVFSSIKEKIFSMNKIWDNLIKNNSLVGNESKKKFYHLNTKEMYDKILKITD